jgi:putative transposase
VSENQAVFPIATMCRLLGVSPSGYYAWTQRRPSQRAQTDAALVAEIRAAHAASRGIYGAPRIHFDLAAKGIRVGRKRVARLMLAAGLAGVSRRKFVTTTVKGDDRQAPDLVDRNFTAERPNLLSRDNLDENGRRQSELEAAAGSEVMIDLSREVRK